MDLILVHCLLVILGRIFTSTIDGEASTVSLLGGCSKKGEASLVSSRAYLSSSEQRASKLLAGDCTATEKSISQYQ